MPVTTLMTLLGSVAFITSWILIGHRMKQSPSGGSRQIRLLRGYFLHMGIFCAFLFVPHVLLGTAPWNFASAMAMGYIVGHVFCYIAFMYLLRVTFSMVPTLASKDFIAVLIGVLATIAITIVTVRTMLFGTLPQYDFERNLTQFNVAPIVGGMIAVYAIVSMFPAAFLFLSNGIRNPNARVRSFLLGGGLLVTMVAGPMHDVAKNWQVYMAADLISVVGITVVTIGVLYRFEEKITRTALRPASARS